MQIRPAPALVQDAITEVDSHPLVVVGITHPATCLVLRGRLRALRSAGFRVVLISGPGPLLDQVADEEGIAVVRIPSRREIAPLADLASLWHIFWALRTLRPDMTEFSTPKVGFLGTLAAKLCGVPVRVYMLRGLRLETLRGLRQRIVLAAERIAAACAHLVVCNSESLRAKAIALRIAPESKLRLIGSGSSNGVDVERFAPGPGRVREDLGIAPDEPVVGFVGRLTQDKGVPELVAAFDEVLRAVPSARLLLVGWFDKSEDLLSEELRRRIERHPRIIQTGFVGDTAPYYKAMDMMVLPTWREGFPNVVLEAAATEIPVITTLSTGSRDAVLPEVTGILIPAGYPHAVSEAVLRLIGNPKLRQRMGRAGREWVIDQFVNGHVLGLTVGFYKGLLEEATKNKGIPLATDAAAAGD